MPWCNFLHVTSWSLLFGAAHLLFCLKSFQPLCLQVFFCPPTNPQDSSYSYTSPFDHLSPRYFNFFGFLSLCISFWIVFIVVPLSSFIHLFFCNVDSTVKLIQCTFLLIVFYEIQFGWLTISDVAIFWKCGITQTSVWILSWFQWLIFFSLWVMFSCLVIFGC